MAKNKATLNIDPGLHQEIKVEAAKRGLKINELAERLMRGGLR
ncbi:unnamed protein product, partial [marine sediment metagenome]